MVAETVSHPKTPCSKRHGLKKVFSVPVGKLRTKLVTPGRNGSSSRSGSRSVSQHKVLLRNNRDLARALSSEKERTRVVANENFNLRARLHETRLEVHGLEKQVIQSNQSLSVYRTSIMNHLTNAVKHSVSLTESLKEAMALCLSKPKDLQILKNVIPALNMPTTTSQPQKLKVNPMVSGHTIRHPTISLKRVVVSYENNIVERNVASSEQQVPETIEDESQSLEETQERPGGLSTCFEEDEVANLNLNESPEEEEESEANDSIRRKMVSFRNTLEKDRNRSGLKDSESSSSNEMYAHQDVESNCLEQVPGENCKIPNNSNQLPLTDKTSMPENCLKRNPVVTLNDISRFLHNSNSVNVQKVILDIDTSKPSGKVGGVALEESSSEKENCPKLSPMKKSISEQSCVSSRIDSNLLKETNELHIEGSIDTNSFPDNEKRNAVSTNSTVQTVVVPRIDEDPLEGTSWMHMQLFSEKKKRTNNGDCRRFSKKTCPKAQESKKSKVNSNNTVNTTIEKFPVGTAINQLQEDSDILADNVKERSNEYDVSGFDIGLENCPIAQSTPMNHGKNLQNGNVISASDVPTSSSKSTKDINSNNSCVSPDDIISQGNNQINEKEGEKNLVVPVGDTKLDGKAFVTVRVKRLNLPALSPTNSLTSSPNEVDDNDNQMCDEVMDFLGFGANSDSEEKIMMLKSIMVSRDELEARDIPGSVSTAGSLGSMWSASETQDSRGCSEGDASDAPTGESGRPRRRAAPKDMKEPSRNKKLRQEATVKKNKKTTKRTDSKPM